MTIRFHLDEHVHPGIAIGLRAYGVDVTTTFEAGLAGQSDPDQLAFSVQESRVLVTHDSDFLRPQLTHDSDFLRLQQGAGEHGGIVYCHQQKYSVGQLLRMLYLVYQSYTKEEMDGRVEYL